MTQPQPHQPHPYAGYGVPPAAYYGPPPVPLAPNGQPLAGFGARLGAYLIDSIVLTGIALVLAIPVAIAMIAYIGTQTAGIETDPVTGDVTGEPNPFTIVGPILAFEFGLFLLILGGAYVYYVELFRKSGGVTLGKRALGLAIIRIDYPGAPVDRGVLAKRWLMQFMVGTFVPFFSWIDGLWQLWDKPFQQCLHDKVAKTVVVRVNK